MRTLGFQPIRLAFWMFCSLLAWNTTGQEMDFGKRIEGDSLHIDVRNYLLVDAEVFLEVRDSVADQVRITPYSLVKARDTAYNILGIPLSMVPDSTVVLTDFVSVKAIMGNPDDEPDDYRYVLPFRKGKTVNVIQGFGGNFSHNTDKSRFAVDLDLAIGDTVYAARPGVVIRVREDFTERGGRDMIDKANLVNILHDDGTIAAYVHLDHNGALVEVGEQVELGQPIGISGFTGFTTTPHLHFVVRKARNESIYFRFEGYNRKRIRSGIKLEHR
jgi:murein DD-endopeptidase MepM/ murein hydrolase activator NlpD